MSNEFALPFPDGVSSVPATNCNLTPAAQLYNRYPNAQFEYQERQDVANSDPMRRFVCLLTIPGIGTISGEGPNKKAAKHNVAQHALSQLNTSSEQSFNSFPSHPPIDSEMQPTSDLPWFPTALPSTGPERLQPKFESCSPSAYADQSGYFNFDNSSRYAQSSYPFDSYYYPSPYGYNPYEVYGWMPAAPLPVPLSHSKKHISTVPPLQSSAIPFPPDVPPTVSQPEFLEVIPHPDARVRASGRTFPSSSHPANSPGASPTLAQRAAHSLKRKAIDTLKRGAGAVSVKQSCADSEQLFELPPLPSCSLPQVAAASEDDFYSRLATEVVPQLVEQRFEALAPALASRNSAFPTYSVMAAMVVTRDLELSSAELVCLTTGTKCVAGDWLDHNGRGVNDSHAEILARRAFVAHVFTRLSKLVDALDEAHRSRTAAADSAPETETPAAAPEAPIGQSASSSAAVEMLDGSQVEREAASNARVQKLLDDSWFEPVPVPPPTSSVGSEHESTSAASASFGRRPPLFRLKSGVRVHLYVSSTPCGDARVFCTGPGELDDEDDAPPALEADVHSLRKSRGLIRVKIEAGEGTIPTINFSEGRVQTVDGVLLGARLLTNSCSDKLLKWNCVGLQGGLLSTLLSEPVFLSSLIVDKYFSAPHLQRAVFARINAQPPAPIAAPAPFLSLPARLEQDNNPRTELGPAREPTNADCGEDMPGAVVEARAPRILSVHCGSNGASIAVATASGSSQSAARRTAKATRYAVLWLSLPPAAQLLQVLETRTGRLVPANPAEQRVGGVSIACRRSLFRLFWLLVTKLDSSPYFKRSTPSASVANGSPGGDGCDVFALMHARGSHAQVQYSEAKRTARWYTDSKAAFWRRVERLGLGWWSHRPPDLGLFQIAPPTLEPLDPFAESRQQQVSQDPADHPNLSVE